MRVETFGPVPPEVYRVRFNVPGLMLDGDSPVQIDQHACEIRLPLGYPRDQPYCVPLTPLFHPNVSEHYCIADYWFAGQSLVDVIAKIGEMIQYQVFNTKSPLNATAAYWAEQHPQLFPIGHTTLTLAEPEISLKPRAAFAATVPEDAPGVAIKLGKE